MYVTHHHHHQTVLIIEWEWLTLLGTVKELWGVKSLGSLGLEAHKVILVPFGVCGALGPKFNGRRPVIRNLGMGPNVMSLGLWPLVKWLLEPFMAF